MQITRSVTALVIAAAWALPASAQDISISGIGGDLGLGGEDSGGISTGIGGISAEAGTNESGGYANVSLGGSGGGSGGGLLDGTLGGGGDGDGDGGGGLIDGIIGIDDGPGIRILNGGGQIVSIGLPGGGGGGNGTPTTTNPTNRTQLSGGSGIRSLRMIDPIGRMVVTRDGRALGYVTGYQARQDGGLLLNVRLLDILGIDRENALIAVNTPPTDEGTVRLGMTLSSFLSQL